MDGLKIIALGDSETGKTSLIAKLIKDAQPGNTCQTLHLWDTAGQERFNSVTQQYLVGSDCILLTFDITNRSSFDRCSFWYEFARQTCNTNEIYILVGTKSDLQQNRTVDQEEAQDYAESINARYYETSAVTGDNTYNLLVQGALNQIMDRTPIQRPKSIKLENPVIAKKKYDDHPELMDLIESEF
eukprot:gene7614-8908_t